MDITATRYARLPGQLRARAAQTRHRPGFVKVREGLAKRIALCAGGMAW